MSHMSQRWPQYQLPRPHEPLFSILRPDFWLETLNLLVLVEGILHRRRGKMSLVHRPVSQLSAGEIFTGVDSYPSVFRYASGHRCKRLGRG